MEHTVRQRTDSVMVERTSEVNSFKSRAQRLLPRARTSLALASLHHVRRAGPSGTATAEHEATVYKLCSFHSESLLLQTRSCTTCEHRKKSFFNEGISGSELLEVMRRRGASYDEGSTH
ncbi:hypothetical protein Q8A67_013058 [Cirrhinus molitorella]|uniref:Uncharacterized protein n=1 Tax=Cirrhinus molitorella TaxID=172907 RepID=A0AA88TKF7_9TELE|nr:hypothetical protein Q8A67_013058 [Cirrhinus molitorella]